MDSSRTLKCRQLTCTNLFSVFCFHSVPSLSAKINFSLMDFRNIASDSHFVDKDTEEVMVRYQPVFTEYTILAE